MIEESNVDNHRRLQTEINKHKVDIDYSVFRKTPKEREKLRRAKAEHKRLYG